MIRRGPSIAPLFLAAYATSCAAAPPVEPPAPPRPPPAAREAPLVTPARLVRFPSCAGGCELTARYDLGKEGCLGLTEGGGRWLAPSCGAAFERAAGAEVGRSLVAYARQGDDHVFLDGRGGLHVAASPLGDFTAHVPAPARDVLAAALPSGGAVVFTPRGALRREGSEWKPLAGAPERIVGAAARGAAVLALQAPERLLRSDDAGVTWAPVALPVLGAVGVRPLDGVLSAIGPAGANEWRPGAAPAAAARAPSLEPELAEALPRGELAAAIDDARVLTIDNDASGRPHLVHGPLAGPWRAEPLPAEPPCFAWGLAAQGARVAYACADGEAVKVYLREGAGAFVELGRLPSSTEVRVGVAVSPTGAVFVTGVCPTAVPCAGGLGRFTKGEKPKVAPTGADVVATAPAVSFDGSRVYALGNTEGSPQILVSRDGGASFSKRALELRVKGAPIEDEYGHAEAAEFQGSLDAISVVTIGEDGELGVRVAAPEWGGYAWAALDSEGTPTHVSEAATMVAGYGRRHLRTVEVYLEDGRVLNKVEEGEGDAYEPTGVDPEPMGEGGARQPVCGRAGCVLGTWGLREGWGHQASLPRPEEPHPPAAALPPLACELDPSQQKPLAVRATDTPSLHSVGRGDVAWWTLQRTPEVRVTVANAASPRAPGARATAPALRLVEKSLLPKRKSGEEDRFEELPTGYAAIRSGAAGFEVAWEDLVKKRGGRASFRGAERPGRVGLTGDGGAVLLTDRAVHVLAQGGGKTSYPLPSGARPAGLVLLPIVDKQPVVLELPDDGSVPLVASSWPLGAGGASLTTGVWPRGGWAPSGVLATSLDGRPALAVVPVEAGAFAAPIERDGGLGVGRSLPDAAGLGAAPRPCTADERASTPRVAILGGDVPRFRRWARLAGTDEEWWTLLLVVQGTAGSPCLSGLGGTTMSGALILDGEAQRGWYVDLGTGARAVLCKPDPALQPPPDP